MAAEWLAVGLALVGHALWYATAPRSRLEREGAAPRSRPARASGCVGLGLLLASLAPWAARYGAALGLPAGALAAAAIASLHAIAAPLDRRALPISAALGALCLALGVLHA